MSKFLNDRPWILGLSASHNGAACLLHGDEIVVAVQEERLSRRKRTRISGMTAAQCIRYCLDYASLSPEQLDAIALSVQGRLSDLSQQLICNEILRSALVCTPVFTLSHHHGHAVHAFATSGFTKAMVLVIDGMGSPIEDLTDAERAVVVGDRQHGWEALSVYAASEITLQPVYKYMVADGDWLPESDDRMWGFHSLGGMYAAAAHQIFGDSNEAGKVMGLAPYGEPCHLPSEFVEIEDDACLRFKEEVRTHYRSQARWPQCRESYQNLACSVQKTLEEVVFSLAQHFRDSSPDINLCYSGGVALNCPANERLIQAGGFRDVYIAAAAEDSGVAIGAAYFALWQLTGVNTCRRLEHDAMGRVYNRSAVFDAIQASPGVHLVSTNDVIDTASALLQQGYILGWFQGRSELGPRALGQRSILCDPRQPDAKDVLNHRVKHREAYRPYAPSVLLEETPNWFDVSPANADSPFMLRTYPIRPHKAALVPAVVHVDGTSRVQTLKAGRNGRFYDLVDAFFQKTGVPMLLNTSFNIAGEPIVETPQDALACFLNTKIDYCVIEEFIVRKNVKS